MPHSGLIIIHIFHKRNIMRSTLKECVSELKGTIPSLECFQDKKSKVHIWDITPSTYFALPVKLFQLKYICNMQST